MRGGAVRVAGRCIGLTVAGGVAAAANAQQAQTELYVSTGIDAESNPYSTLDGDTASVAATVDVQPQLRLRTATTELDLQGSAQFRQFFRRYGLEDNYAGNANLTARQSDRLTLRASAGAAYNQGGFNSYAAGLSPTFLPGAPASGGDGGLVTTPVTTPVIAAPVAGGAALTPLTLDPTLLGTRTRTTSYQAGAGFDGRLSGRTQLSGDLGVSALRYQSLSFNDFNSANAEFRISQTLNERLSVGLIGSAQKVDYLAGRTGDALITSVLLSVDRRLGASWSLSLSAGGSFTTLRQPAGLPDAHLTAVTIRGRFCKQTQRGELCVNGQRSPQPSAGGGVRTTTSVDASYSARLSERDHLTLSGSYSRTGGADQGVVLAQPTASYGSVSALADRQLTQRVSFFTSLSAARIYSPFAPRRANIGVSAGLRFRLGAL